MNEPHLTTPADLALVCPTYALILRGKAIIYVTDSMDAIEARRGDVLSGDPDADLYVVEALDLVHADPIADRAISAGAIRTAQVILEHGQPEICLDWLGTFNFREEDIREGGTRQEAYRLAWIKDKSIELGIPFAELEKMLGFSFGPATAEDLYDERVDVIYLSGIPALAYREAEDLEIEEISSREHGLVNVEEEMEQLARAGITGDSALDIIARWITARPEIRDEIIEVVCGAVHAARVTAGRKGGKKGGRSTSEAKKSSARENGKKGGRPPKRD